MVQGLRKTGGGDVTYGTTHDAINHNKIQRTPRLQEKQLVTALIRNIRHDGLQHGHEAVHSSQPGTGQPLGGTWHWEEGAGAGDAGVPDCEGLSGELSSWFICVLMSCRVWLCNAMVI